MALPNSLSTLWYGSFQLSVGQMQLLPAQNEQQHTKLKELDMYHPTKVAISQGHETFLLKSTDFVNGWFNKKYNGGAGWVLLAYFASDSNDPTTIDEIISPTNKAVTSWLDGTTITYIVFPIQSTAVIPLSSLNEQNEYELDYLVDRVITMKGLEAAQTLLERNYKLQLLSASHYFDPDAGEGKEFRYGPNALFGNKKQVHRFLYWSALEVLKGEVRHLLKQKYKQWLVNNMGSGGEEKVLKVHFHALIFATQGLDLAIPSRSSYLDISNHKACLNDDGSKKLRCDPKLNARALNNTIFMSCPSRHDSVHVQFVENAERPKIRMSQATDFEKNNGIFVSIRQSWLKHTDAMTNEIEIWKGHPENVRNEAVCVKTDKSALLPRVSCVTRVQTQNFTLPAPPMQNDLERPNLLVVMIDPLSRSQLKRSLSNTAALLELMGFVNFDKYTAVGKNSGPNQAALYSGQPLEGRDIKSTGEGERVWLWDRLSAEGYVTMKAEDGCVSNSNMVQSIDPKTHHGSQLQEMFCYSFDRPNCLGGKLAAEHLVEYTLQFINTYNRDEEKPKPQARPWAAFVSFIDSHEDTSTLISYLDTLFVRFLQEVIATKNTMILFLSDHGLHYGPTFESKAALIEQAQPLLMMRLPSFKPNDVNVIKNNANLFTTAFDVHETILDFLLQQSSGDGAKGKSLLKPLSQIERGQCDSTSGVPQEFCTLFLEASLPRDRGRCSFMDDPPSVLSFYSDISPKNRPIWPESCPHTQYTLRTCGHHELDETLELDIHVTRNEALVQKRKRSLAEAMHHSSNNSSNGSLEASRDLPPNIIFLEIDSVSLSYSERFFPKTWSLLKQHEIVNNKCPTGWCAAAFNRTSVVGQSSIVNQLAALSGCVDHVDSKEKLKHYEPSTYCYNGGKDSTKNKEGDHWIFEIAKRLGYVTFFGEEFCYEESPYVVQTQTAFTLNEDITPHKLFCDLAKDWIRRHGKVNAKVPTWDVNYDTPEVSNSCFDGMSRGEIGLTFIIQMFEQYPDLPKFAFINALAAHDYSLDASRAPLSSENYDLTVYNFLSMIMARSDDRPTYIILRSDHGLQGGPYPVDYSFQIEHMHPWTTIIAPASHARSIESLAVNQDRLVTGFDIYHSIRSLMSPSEDKSDLIGIPPWSYNLLQEKVPDERNCDEAKIPRKFCPCTAERDDMFPSFYIGYSEQPKKYDKLPGLTYDWKTQQFGATLPPGVRSTKFARKYEVNMNNFVTKPTCNTTLGSYIDKKTLHDSWKMIDNITSLFPGSEVSGGIFLYPRQSILLTYLIQKEIASRGVVKSKTGDPVPFRICETGFGSGHSSALFLSASPHVEVISFDLFDRPYQTVSALALNGYFGNRLKQVKGDSCKKVKSYSSQCDFLHGSSLCQSDNIDLLQKSGAGTTLTSTAMNSLEDNSVYFGKRNKATEKYGKDAQWATLHRNGCIENITCFEEESRALDGKLRLARGKDQTISHKFCFAINTGKCGNTFPAKTSVWHRVDFCTAWKTHCPAFPSTTSNNATFCDPKGANSFSRQIEDG